MGWWKRGPGERDLAGFKDVQNGPWDKEYGSLEARKDKQRDCYPELSEGFLPTVWF